MQRITGILLFAALLWPLAGTAGGKVYKTVDKDGHVTYTDQKPSDDARPMDLPNITTIQAPANTGSLPANPPGRAASAGQGYEHVTIVQPAADETFWGTGGDVLVRVVTVPALHPEHRVQILLDGLAVSGSENGTAQLTGVERGEHDIMVRVIDGQDHTVATAGPVTFYVKQHSVLQPKSALQALPSAPNAPDQPSHDATSPAKKGDGGSN